MNDELYLKLTSSGKAGLKVVSEDFAETILETAYHIAERNHTGDIEISLRDVMEAKNMILQNQTFSHARKYLLMSFSLIFVGIIYLLFGFYQIYKREFNGIFETGYWLDDRFFVLLIGFLFIFLALCTTFIILNKELLQYKKIKNEKIYYINDIDTLLKQWQRIENIGKKIIEEETSCESNNVDIGNIYKKIEERLPNEYKTKMNNILNLRNNFLHGSQHHTTVEISKAISDSNEIIDILESK